MLGRAIQAVVLVSVSVWLLQCTPVAALTQAPSASPPTLTPTPTNRTPTCFFPTRPPTPSVSFEVHPGTPEVGDVVQVTLVINQGYNGPPSPIFADLHLASSTTLEMTAVAAGTGTVSVGFVYEVVDEICDVEPFYIYELWNGGGSIEITVLPRDTPTPTPLPTSTECSPSAPDSCPVGKQCICCCGTYVCMPPYLPCCALPCSDETPLPTPTPTPMCHPIVGLTDCQADSDCVVVNQSDCCPCSSGGHQAAINGRKQDELSQQLEVCCAAAGVCLPVYQCEEFGAICRNGTCALVNTGGTPTPTPTLPTNTCNGDCDGDGAVTVNEIIVLVNIALGTATEAACPNFSGCGDLLDVTCIIRIIGFALNGCPGTTPTASVEGACMYVVLGACADASSDLISRNTSSAERDTRP